MIMPCTVIRTGDLADQMLDREKNPQWHGERTKLLYAFPKNEALWDEYARLRAESLRADGDGREATEYYAASRAEMDEGAVPGWPARHNSDELSAVQHAMNLKLRDETAFWAEYQNEPLVGEEAVFTRLNLDLLGKRRLPFAPGAPPAWTEAALVTVDIGAHRCHWELSVWHLMRGCSVVLDAGYVTTGLDEDGRWTLAVGESRRTPLLQAAIETALRKVSLLYPDGLRTGGAVLPIFYGVDCGGSAAAAGESGADLNWTASILVWCQQHRGRWFAFKGQGRWSERHWTRAGERLFAYSDRGFYELHTNAYKTQLYSSMHRPLLDEAGAVAIGARGFAERLRSDYLKQMLSEESAFDGTWSIVGRVPNHWWDCAYMSFALAEIVRTVRTAQRRPRVGVVGRAFA
jgi:hypothetical protein